MKIKAKLSEKIAYAFGNMGGYVLWAFIGVYITIYATECLSLSKDLLTILGTIILVCRFFDGISDIFMGIIIEKTHSKVGKARFWFGLSMIPLTIVFFFLFFSSNLGGVSSLVLISILYFLFTVIFYTMNNVSFNAMLPRISNDSYDQSNICTLNSIFTSIGSLVSAIAIPILNALGGEASQNSWTIFVLILSIVALGGMAVCFFFVKEKKEIVVENPKVASKDDIKHGIKALFKTKYFYIAVLLFAINYFISLSVSSVGKYYAQFVLNNENLFSWFGSLPMITMGLGLVLTPLLVKKFKKEHVLTAAICCVLLGNIVGSCGPFNIPCAFVGVMVKGLGSAVVMSQLFTLAPDMVKYVEAKEGLRIEGLAASANSFGCKIGSGLGSAVVIWSIALCGYVSTSATQTSLVIYTFISLYWWVPTLLSIILLVLSLFWDCNKQTEAIIKAKEPLLKKEEI
jgi:GPH family glycoside/pentoside/hexuronide:cation symporter